MNKKKINTVDIKENSLLKIDRELLEILLKDKTSGRNIIWATDNYLAHGQNYSYNSEITVKSVTSYNGNIIKPRIEKSKQEQESRIRTKAEVFTPSWICNAQNNLVDKEWFGKGNIFNTEDIINHTWKSTKSRILFPNKKKKTWKDYVKEKRLEITCGEAPYITSRYDTVTGNFISVPDRIGILDRKLRIVNENTDTREDWLEWAYNALTNTYAYEWQGDNLLIARENILYTVKEHFFFKFGENVTTENLKGFAKVIAWNIWQMDGLKFVIPGTCVMEDVVEEDLFERRIISKACEGCKKNNPKKHNGIYCIVKDWETREKFRFVDLLKMESKNGL